MEGRRSRPNSDKKFYRRHQSNEKEENTKGKISLRDKIRELGLLSPSNSSFRCPYLRVLVLFPEGL